MKIAVFSRKTNPGIAALVNKLRARGVPLAVYGTDFTSWEDLPADTELFLSLGGDGTFLRSLTFVRDRGIPVAGINFGRLGFLTTARADDSGSWLDDLLAGRYSVEERGLLTLECDELPEGFYPYALNEISLQRSGARMPAVHVRVDGLDLPTYWADGLVVATPTGSTAYALSVGGPVIFPKSDALVLAPIAPHNLNVRPLVVPFSSTVELRFESRDGEALLAVDNRPVRVSDKVRIVIRRGEYGLRYVEFSDNNFIQALRDKLLWGEDRRNSQ